MSNNQKKQRVIEVSFTKISEDVIVPTWRNKGGDGFSFKETKFIWWILVPLWLFFGFVIPSHLRMGGLIITAPIFCALGYSFYLIMNIPQKWIELNRNDGFISVWTSRKKRKLIGRWHNDMIAIKMNRRWISSGPRGQTSEHRYLIELFDNDPEMKNTSFWKYDNNPKSKGVPFFVLFDLFGDPHPFTEESDYALAFALTDRIGTFVRDFLTGQPIAPNSTSTYTFTVPE